MEANCATDAFARGKKEDELMLHRITRAFLTEEVKLIKQLQNQKEKSGKQKKQKKKARA